MPKKGDKQQDRVGERSGGGPGVLVTVPAGVVYELRRTMHLELSCAAQDIDEVAVRKGQVTHPEWYEEPLARFDAIRALLDEMGWWNIDPPAEISLDLRAHRLVVTRALETALLLADADMKDLDAVEVERARRGEPSRREATTQRVSAISGFAVAVKDLAGQGRSDE
jgi:hypothetical protein